MKSIDKLTKREREFLDLGISMALSENGRLNYTELEMFTALMEFEPSLAELSALDDFVQLLLTEVLTEDKNDN